MLDVFLTVDVEIWCDGWENLDAKFPDAFRRYVYGQTPHGDYGLPYQTRALRDHGLRGVFFVEPLFATRFGTDPLEEIVGLLKQADQEIQLHLHTEWADEAEPKLLSSIDRKVQFLHMLSMEDQAHLIGLGAALLRDAGGGSIRAFRAGSFGFNRASLTALRNNGIEFDSSYNASTSGPQSGVLPGTVVTDSCLVDGVYEYPMTVFSDGTSALRHVQLTACSSREIERLMWRALETERRSFVLLSHNFELLNAKRNSVDPVVVDRFEKLCSFLDKNRDCFRVSGFSDLNAVYADAQPPPLSSPLWTTAARMVEQLSRRRYG